MLNTYEHEDADRLAESVRAAVPQIAALIERARDRRGAGRLGERQLRRLELIRREAGRARRWTAAIPSWSSPCYRRDDDMFVIKTRHSVFFSTPLEYLLESIDVGRIVLAGQVTEQCILYSAVDGYVGHFEVAVPRDGVAHIYEHLAKSALEMMERNMHAEIVAARDLRLG